jgi:hypothetical protein
MHAPLLPTTSASRGTTLNGQMPRLLRCKTTSWPPNKIFSYQMLGMRGGSLSLEVLDAIQMVNQIKLVIEEARSQLAMSVFRPNRLNYSGAALE